MKWPSRSLILVSFDRPYDVLSVLVCHQAYVFLSPRTLRLVYASKMRSHSREHAFLDALHYAQVRVTSRLAITLDLEKNSPRHIDGRQCCQQSTDDCRMFIALDVDLCVQV